MDIYCHLLLVMTHRFCTFLLFSSLSLSLLLYLFFFLFSFSVLFLSSFSFIFVFLYFLGNYQFILRDLSNAIAFSAEVWISLTPSPLNLVKVFNITKVGTIHACIQHSIVYIWLYYVYFCHTYMCMHFHKILHVHVHVSACEIHES